MSGVHVEGVRRLPSGGYRVLADRTFAIVGYVKPVYAASHIRRGRLQASPWWQAYDVAGESVGEPHERRRDAATELDR